MIIKFNDNKVYCGHGFFCIDLFNVYEVLDHSENFFVFFIQKPRQCCTDLYLGPGSGSGLLVPVQPDTMDPELQPLSPYLPQLPPHL